jgi:3-oxoacyl-[acyl-carrier protein] reductase
MNCELEGRVAIVTGAAQNIGRAIAVSLGGAGASVVVNAKTSARLAEETAGAVRSAGGKALVHLADISNPGEGAALISAAVKQFGGLDILINNAAIRRETAFADLGWAEWREIVSVILDGAYICAHAALPYLEKSAAGCIVNIGGLSAHSGAPNRAHVIAAKAGLVGLTRALAQDLGAAGITVNCVVPGLIDTIRGGHASPAVPAHHKTRGTLLGRQGKPEEVAALVRFLCGPGARYITGQTLHANGGAFMP